ncbi:putative porin [Candidatus Hydrogenedentota bacterium]
MKNRFLCLGLSVGILCCSPTALAEESKEIAELKEMVEQQQSTIKALAENLAAMEARQAEVAAAVEKMETAQDDLKDISWVKNVKVGGDFRYRHEWQDMNNRRGGDRNRQRIRARFNIDAKVNDEWDLGFRLATGGADPLSTNQTLDMGFSTKGINLDRAFFDWHPKTVPGLHVIGGKMANPFYKPGKSKLIWDGDLNPEGIVINYKGDRGLFANVGGFYVEENSRDADTSLWAAQVGMDADLCDAVSFIGGVSYYHYGNVETRAPIFDPTDSFGNTTNFFGNYNEDYHLLEVFAELGTKIGDVPLKFYGDWVTNIAAAHGDASGWLAGMSLGKCKKPWSWEFKYDYRDVERNAVVGAFTDSDFGGGGTGHAGHTAGAGLQLSKNMKTSLTYCNTERGYEKVQADLNFKF